MCALFDAEVAGLYARHRGSVDEAFMDEVAALLPPGLVLDVGAGVGAPASALVRRGFDVLAIEPSADMIAEGLAEHPEVRFVQARGEGLPLKDGCAGSAVVLYVLHHADDPRRLLAEAGRSVARGGPVLVASGRAGTARQAFFQDYFPTLSPGLPEPAEVRRWARGTGLRVVEVLDTVHWLYASRVIDDAYLGMVEEGLFANLRQLSPREFDEGVGRLRADRGRPLPPPEVAITVLRHR